MQLRFGSYLLMFLTALIPLGCSDDGPSSDDEVGDGDDDGDPGDGDGDGDPGDGDPGLPPGFLDELTKFGGCGDVFIGATDEAATMGMQFNGAEIAATAHMLEETQVRVSELPSDDVSLRIVLGSDLDETCNDVGPGPTVDVEWTAVSGTVTLTIVPTGDPEPWQVPAYATLELTDVTFESAGRSPVVIDSWSVADVYVGWFPG
jgi:hypothetical protein